MKAVSKTWLARNMSVLLQTIQVVAIVGGGGLTVFTFWYNESYRPRQLRPNLIVSPVLEPAGENGSVRAVRAVVTIRNASPVQVHVLTSRFVVFGISTGQRRALSDSVFADSVGRIATVSMRPLLRYSSVRQEEVVATGQLLEPGWFFEPNEEATRDVVAYLPKDRFDRISFGVAISAAKNPDAFCSTLYARPGGELAESIYVLADSIHTKQPACKNQEPFVPGSNPRHTHLDQESGFVATDTYIRMSLWDRTSH